MAISTLKNTLIVVFTIGFSATVIAETMYKWKDEKGIPQYTQTPPENQPYETIEVARNDQRNRITPSIRTTSQTQSNPSFANQTPKTDVERYKAARDNNCVLAKRNLNTLTTVARIRIPDGAGGERLLTDKEKSDKVALTKEQVKSFCSKDNDLTNPKPAQPATNQP